MRHYYSVDTIREAEAPLLASLPEGTLMRRAAFGLATAIVRELTARTGAVVGRRVCAVVGSGDNGGDALWAATFLRRRGAAADAVLLNPERTHRKALAAFTKAGGRVVERVATTTDLVIDGWWAWPAPAVASGGRRGLCRGRCRRDPGGRRGYPQRRRRAHRRDHRPSRACRADRDLRWAQTRACARRLRARHAGRYRARPARRRCARLRGRRRQGPLAGARPDDDKYTQGVTGIIAGSSTYPGAAVLCAGAAVAATSGMVRYAGSALTEVLSHWPEVVAAPTPAATGRVQSWVVGPGLGTDDTAAAALWFALDTDLPVIVDGDGLTLLAAHPDLVARREAPTVLTRTPANSRASPGTTG
ncbi:yjeF-related family protein [Mycobacterium xenopi 4042]|uniref:Bifunctional NAD(P)H-hydrate repair enzyme Nnr n=1 Tax=Mycobacterium xenopi 4042 TaxID=1299334 RepID=X7YL59_MYCXE|nr:yjeF-related family protein [Mycobacterium xenopi 4042]